MYDNQVDKFDNLEKGGIDSVNEVKQQWIGFDKGKINLIKTC